MLEFFFDLRHTQFGRVNIYLGESMAYLSSVISFAFYLRVTILLFQSDEPAASWYAGTGLEHAVLAVCTSAVLLFGLFPGILFDLIGRVLP